MNNHLHYIPLYKHQMSESKARINDLKYFVKKELELGQCVLELFALNDFGESNEYIKIKGSYDLIEAFNSIDEEKLDVTDELRNVEFIGFNDKDEIILHFNDGDISASGIYDFTHDFFEDLFSMAKYANFCIDSDYKDIIIENLEQLFDKLADKQMQYRLIKRDEEYFLRGITSPRYNNYDNSVALYITLLNLHRYAKENGVEFKVDKAYMSDSEIRIFLEEEEPHKVDGIGDVYFGVVLVNNEIRECKFSLEIRYRLVDLKDKNLSFTAIPSLKDSVFDISHAVKPANLKSKIVGLGKIEILKNTMLDYMNYIKKSPTLSSDAIYKLMSTITYSRELKAESRKNAKDLYDKNIINNTLTLIQVFDKVNQITTDINERMHLERIYHELIKDLASKDKH